MPSVLWNVLRFTGLTVGVPSVQAHGIFLNGVAAVPQEIRLSSNGYTVGYDATNITITRLLGADADVDVEVMKWHSTQDAEPLAGGIPANRLPFIMQSGSSTGGSGADVPPGWLNVKDFGAVGDNVTNDRVAIQAALDAAQAAGGAVVWFPPGKYIVGRNAANSYCLTMNSYSNITLMGVKGSSWIKQIAGLPNASVAALRMDACRDCTVRDLGIDGNWGNAVTRITQASTNVTLPQATINVEDTTNFPASGTYSIVTPTSVEVITYTGKTSTSFTGCTGGTATIIAGQKCGYVNSQNGINQTTQGDPKNYGLMLRGCFDILVDNALFTNTYGDGIWVGGTSANNTPGDNIRIQNTNINISARSGVAIAGNSVGCSIFNCRFENILASALDTEPIGGVSRNVTIEDTLLGAWFDPGRAATGPVPLSIVGGSTTAPMPITQASKYRVSDCTVEGGSLIQGAVDVTIERCRIINDFFPSGTQATAPICVTNSCDGIKLVDNWIYDRVAGTAGGNHEASIQVRFAVPASLGRNQPTDVLIRGNTVHARNTIEGIRVTGVGGGSVANVFTPSVSGVAEAVTGLTMTDTGAGWTVDQWVGWSVRIGAATAAIVSNTSEILTLDGGTGAWVSLAWGYPLGDHAPTPSPGAYTIFKPIGFVDVDNNAIDCSNDGYGQGGVGIFMSNQEASNSAGGMRVACRNNKVRNCATNGIYIDFVGATRWEQLWIHDNTGFDDQGTPTMTTLLRFNGTPTYDQMVLRGNQADPTVTTTVAGLTTGTWFVNGGMVPQWAGFGSPETVITAPVGSMYQRANGTAGFVLYMKESGSGNTGWVAYANPTSASPKVVHQTFPVTGTATLQNLAPVLTATGTPGNGTQSSGSVFDGYTRVNVVSAAGAGSASGYRNTAGNYRRGVTAGGGFRVVWRFGVNDAVLVATANMFVGLSADLAAPTDVAPSTLANILGVGCDNGDTTLQLYAAGAVAQARTNLGASFPVNTVGIDVYELELQCDPAATTVNYKVTRLNTGDQASGVISVGAQLPLGSQPLTHTMWRANGGTAAAVTIAFFSYYAEVAA